MFSHVAFHRIIIQLTINLTLQYNDFLQEFEGTCTEAFQRWIALHCFNDRDFWQIQSHLICIFHFSLEYLQVSNLCE